MKLFKLLRSKKKITESIKKAENAVITENVIVEKKTTGALKKGHIVEKPDAVKARADLVADIVFVLGPVSVIGAHFLGYENIFSFVGENADIVAAFVGGSVLLFFRISNVVSTAKTGLFSYIKTTEHDKQG